MTGPNISVVRLPTVVTVAGAGPQGPRGADGANGDTVVMPAGETLSGHRVVTRTPDGAAVYAGNTNLAHAGAPLWLTMNAATIGGDVTAQDAGIVDEPSWSWIPDAPLFLGVAGALTQTIPTADAGAVFLVKIGVATSATSIVLEFGPPIVLASGAVSGGTPGDEAARYVYLQAVPAATWIIDHGLSRKVHVTVFDSGEGVVYADVAHGSINQTTVSFPNPVTGSVVIS